MTAVVLRSLAFGSSLTLRLLRLLDALLLLLIALCSTTNRRLLLARLPSPPSAIIFLHALRGAFGELIEIVFRRKDIYTINLSGWTKKEEIIRYNELSLIWSGCF
jgi:hypothetical protein